MAKFDRAKAERKAIKALVAAGQDGLTWQDLGFLDPATGTLAGRFDDTTDTYRITRRRQPEQRAVQSAVEMLADKGYVVRFENWRIYLDGWCALPEGETIPKPSAADMELPAEQRFLRFLQRAGRRGSSIDNLYHWEREPREINGRPTLRDHIEALKSSGYVVEHRQRPGSGVSLRLIDSPEHPMLRGQHVPAV